jgi:sugar/nucleoside kinase (ribokinase family)
LHRQHGDRDQPVLRAVVQRAPDPAQLGGVRVEGGGALTIGPGATLKFFAGGNVTVAVGGSLTIDPSAWLTCIADDHHADTNADGAGSSPATGDRC